MKKLIFVLISAVTILTAGAQDCPTPPGTQLSPCPIAPEGYCPYVEAFALTDVYTVQEPCSIGFPPSSEGGFIYTAIRIIFTQTIGREYELQFTRSLSSPLWIAYARMTAIKTDYVLTDCPIYECDPQRFFRVMLKPLLVPVQAAQQQRVFHSTLLTSKVNFLHQHHAPSK